MLTCKIYRMFCSFLAFFFFFTFPAHLPEQDFSLPPCVWVVCVFVCHPMIDRVPPCAQQGWTRPITACRRSRDDRLPLRGLRASSRIHAAGASILPLHRPQLKRPYGRTYLGAGMPFFTRVWCNVLTPPSNPPTLRPTDLLPVICVTAVGQFVFWCRFKELHTHCDYSEVSLLTYARI